MPTRSNLETKLSSYQDLLSQETKNLCTNKDSNQKQKVAVVASAVASVATEDAAASVAVVASEQALKLSSSPMTDSPESSF